MEILNAILQGIIQGLTEFLPISSSGHLAIYQHLTGNSGEGSLMFTVLLHIGTLFAVCLVFRRTIGRLILDFVDMLKLIFTGKFSYKKLNGGQRTVIMMILSSAMLLLLVLPVFGGKSIKDAVEAFSTDPGLFWVIGLMLIATSALMYMSYRITASDRPTHKVATPRDAVLIGLTQCAAAAFPGLSRSGSTTATALACGMEKQAATQYSFILSIPAVAAAALLEFKDAATTVGFADLNVGATIIGVITAAAVGIFAIKAFVWLIKKNRYVIFSYYCAVVGAIVVGISIVEHILSK